MSSRSLTIGLAAAVLAATRLACAQPASASSGAITGQITTLLISMGAVLALIAAAAWLLKRCMARSPQASATLHVVAAAAVGPRERVVVVEVGTTWLVLGVAPGSVRPLHRMPRLAAPAGMAAPERPQRPFAAWLRERLESRI